LDPEQCRVGQWKKTEAHLGMEHRWAMDALEPLHMEIHALARELIRWRQAGQSAAAVARLPELYGLRDRLLSLFMAMLESASPHEMAPSD
jgi:hypothetical protein